MAEAQRLGIEQEMRKKVECARKEGEEIGRASGGGLLAAGVAAETVVKTAEGVADVAADAVVAGEVPSSSVNSLNSLNSLNLNETAQKVFEAQFEEMNKTVADAKEELRREKLKGEEERVQFELKLAVLEGERRNF